MEFAHSSRFEPSWSSLAAASDFWPLGAHVTLSQAVVSQLRARIVSGVLAPGTLLPETALAQQLKVSATPIREAMATLASEGLVEIEAHRLKRVAPLDMIVTRDLLRVQAELWRLGYQWGMPRICPEQVSLLDEAITRYRAALASGEHMAAIFAGLDFHTVFIMASDNRELLRSTLDRRGLIARFIFLHGIQMVSSIGLSQHEAILAAFKADDHAGVLACLDRMSARLLTLCDRNEQSATFIREV
ncbi:GntR family transcriptional regulator [Novosphingobium panipatense]|jgi:DNA-binding GntR family transcriptional regulator|uniref:GntR family transcriptional regulator n=1 Tax=Novosphingobium panipatense TaxID=428991 RepID=UPI0039A2EF5F